jgi:hypothetical protein
MLSGLSELLAEYNVPAAFWMTIKLTVAAAIGALLIGTSRSCGCRQLRCSDRSAPPTSR